MSLSPMTKNADTGSRMTDGVDDREGTAEFVGLLDEVKRVEDVIEQPEVEDDIPRLVVDDFVGVAHLEPCVVDAVAIRDELGLSDVRSAKIDPVDSKRAARGDVETEQ